MQEWTEVNPPTFSVGEQYIFDNNYQKGMLHIPTWSEEYLKMKFITELERQGLTFFPPTAHKRCRGRTK
jgi:hypothetical protein